MFKLYFCVFCVVIQIVERQEIEKMARLNLRQEEEEDQMADAEYQDFLRQETDRLRKKGFQEPVSCFPWKF